MINKILYSIGISLLLCCKETAQDNVQSTSNIQDVKPVYSQTDFFNKKYFTGYNLAIGVANFVRTQFLYSLSLRV
ncbi:hypothetical protein, partial [Chryseobacterium taiwanense]|uniref:hypothetical protein n=1 Tax=Chryseobacterium taiwanense TaxID=363331 RepID=UPI001E3EA873